MDTEAKALTILVADDSVDAAESLAMLLEFEGHVVRIAHDGEQALQVAAGQPPEVAILDIGMPGTSGYDVARRMRAQPWGRDMLLVAATGWSQAEDRRRALEAGFDRHVTKPMDATELAQSLPRWLEAKRSAAAG